jgi:hypothetical protein
MMAVLDFALDEITFPGPELGLPEGLENYQLVEVEFLLPFVKAS